MGSITLTNIPQFFEQPGRNIIQTVGALDRMTVPFLGPYSSDNPFTKDSPDTLYPLMFCTDVTEKRNGGLKELTVNYAGIISTGGASSYVTSPVLNLSPTQGSRDFVQPWTLLTFAQSTVSIDDPTVQASQPTYSAGTITTTVRYIGVNVSLHYQIYPAPGEVQYEQLGL